jgi:hypothetical protein
MAKKKEVEQGSLPGMQDTAIAELDQAAKDYAKKRDRRMALFVEEIDLKAELLTLMKQNKKSHYRHGDIEITIKPEAESVKVKIHKDGEDD